MTTSRLITNDDIERNILAIARQDRERRGVGPADIVISRTMTAEERLAMENRDTRRPMERLLAQPMPGTGSRAPVAAAVAELGTGAETPASPSAPVAAAAPRRAPARRKAASTKAWTLSPASTSEPPTLAKSDETVSGSV